MRRDTSLFQVMPALTGVMYASDSTGVTTYGSSIDTMNFRQVLATLSVGLVSGTNAAPVEVTAQFQESINPTGPFTDIDDGAINGTMSFTAINCLANTSYNSMGKLSESWNDSVRKRYIRVAATAKGTSGNQSWLPINVTVLLTQPSDTLYISNPTTLATGNAEAGSGLFSTFF